MGPSGIRADEPTGPSPRGTELDTDDLEPGSTHGAVGQINVPAVGPCHLFDDTRPESGPVLGRRVARLERLLTLVVGGTGVVVLDVEAGVQRADGDRHLVVPVSDHVPDEGLQELLYAVPVGADSPVDFGDECRRCGRHVSPTRLDQLPQLDRFQPVRLLPAVGEPQQVLDQRVHPVVCVGDGGQMLAGTLLAGQFQMSPGDVQGVPQVM